jgi:hypothetical protein
MNSLLDPVICILLCRLNWEMREVKQKGCLRGCHKTGGNIHILDKQLILNQQSVNVNSPKIRLYLKEPPEGIIMKNTFQPLTFLGLNGFGH